MKKRLGYLTDPATIISIIVALFGFGAVRGTLNYRINDLEKFKNEVNIIEIQKDLSQIKTDLQRLKTYVVSTTR